MQAHIVLLPGDGIGPEIVSQARRVLEAVARRFGHRLELREHLMGGCAIDRSGDPLPGETLEACRRSQAVLLGAVGGPKWDDPAAKTRPEAGLLKIRKELGLFANLRPIRPHAQLLDASPIKRQIVEGTDILFVRELTGGIYFGESGRRPVRVRSDRLQPVPSPVRNDPLQPIPEGGRREQSPQPAGAGHGEQEEAWNTMIYSTAEIERVVRMAGQLARGRRGKVTSVDKANVLEVSRLWRQTAARVMRDEFPDLQYDVVLVDAMAMHLIARPRSFDVVVTGNLFGDILTDEASMLPGSLGLLPSASIGASGPGLYEPIHGSAPDIAGKGIANPLATILAAAMLLRHSLQLETEASAIETAVERVLAAGHRTADIAAGGPSIGTEAMGTHIVEALHAD